jgi:hypothetical protein
MDMSIYNILTESEIWIIEFFTTTILGFEIKDQLSAEFCLKL